jgi:hypoxanthine phosphoribosyltransferase
MTGLHPDPRSTASRPVPAHFKPFAGPDEVRRRVEMLGLEIGEWASDIALRTGAQPLALCVLRGGVFFFSDLLLACPTSVEPAFCRCRAYRPNRNGVTLEHVEIDMDCPPVTGRHVLVVDDICDTGRTLAAVTQRLRDQGAIEVVTAVCIHRRRHDGLTGPNWSAFEHAGREWFVGYGMEDASHFMNHPGLFLITPAEEAA